MDYTNLLELRNLVEDGKKFVLFVAFAIVVYAAYRLNAAYLIYALATLSLHYLLDIVDDYFCETYRKVQDNLETKRIGLEFVASLKKQSKTNKYALAV